MLDDINDIDIKMNSCVAKFVNARIAQWLYARRYHMQITGKVTFENESESSYLNSNYELRTTMFNTIDHAFPEILHVGGGQSLYEAEVRNLKNTKSATYLNLNSLGSRVMLLVSIKNVVCDLVYRAGDDEELQE